MPEIPIYQAELEFKSISVPELIEASNSKNRQPVFFQVAPDSNGKSHIYVRIATDDMQNSVYMAVTQDSPLGEPWIPHNISDDMWKQIGGYIDANKLRYINANIIPPPNSIKQPNNNFVLVGSLPIYATFLYAGGLYSAVEHGSSADYIMSTFLA